MISIVIPAFNEKEMIEKAGQVIGNILKDAEITYDLIFVNDGSSDNTWEIIPKRSREDKNIRGIRFSRNFGKEVEIMAGLTEANGEW